MAYLDALKIIAAVKPMQQSPILNRRTRLVQKLLEQIECTKAKAEGKDYWVPEMKSTNNEAGMRVEIEHLRKVRPWWFTNTDGKLVFEVKYANKRIELTKGKTGIEVENLASLMQAIELLKKAVENGELDNSITNIAKSIRAEITK